MKLLFDGRYIKTNEQEVLPAGGIGRYCYNLLSRLITLDPNLDLSILVPRENTRPIFQQTDCSVREIKAHNQPSSLHTQFLLSKSLNSGFYDLFHSPFNMLPRGLRCRSVVTIHDIMWLTVPELCARFLPERLAAGLLYRLGIHHALKRANHIFTISKSAATAISVYMPECIGRLTAIHHGTEPFFHQIPKEEARQNLRRLSPIPETFVLCVGQGSPYKNHLRAVQAFLQATSTWPEIKLVLVRRFKRFDSQMQRLLQQEKVQKKIVVLPAVTEKELRALYNLAAVLLFPSLEEGFGMPVLEAMACGTPVVASDIPVMREVAQDAALLADPTSTTAIAAELARLLGDENLQQEMAARGLSNLRRFSWQKCAELTLAGYRQVVAGCR